jgi:hypothetical protein
MFGFCAGCGWRGDGLFTVSGRVVLDGEPVAAGDIMFRPLDPHLRAVAGKGTGGGYRLHCPPGEAIVAISSMRIVRAGEDGQTAGQPGGGVPGDTGEIPLDRVPRRYNWESVLRFTVEPHHRNVADFALDGK